MPYLETEYCQKLNILPGAILTGEFSPAQIRNGPHQEDCRYTDLQYRGPCSAREFREILDRGRRSSVEEGFECAFGYELKHVPLDHSINHSIITVPVEPANVEIVEDGFNPGKIKLHFRDASGKRFRFISITDLGFHDYAKEHHEQGDLAGLNDWISNQREIFLRLGLSRQYEAPDGRLGYWLQANGIYTFPDVHEAIRSYGRL